MIRVGHVLGMLSFLLLLLAGLLGFELLYLLFELVVLGDKSTVSFVALSHVFSHQE